MSTEPPRERRPRAEARHAHFRGSSREQARPRRQLRVGIRSEPEGSLC
jgi:hypothetical protein